ncbi:hypothetical protein D8674_012853 [Pyrus ussuriensis x Pyrus communis]|uniref:Uncharacterized protein n=1 Tax=Pyrus ussuriensis x Pyrus communis TaxID=2448454 RepID=A0A5N5H1N9_9ROSA|nr:hypothetical protein D8674_012853 [Pyrus ussuriensis x Pyrus communis]
MEDKLRSAIGIPKDVLVNKKLGLGPSIKLVLNGGAIGECCYISLLFADSSRCDLHSYVDASAISLRTMNLANILILTRGGNYKKWKKEIRLLLALNEFDIALDTPKPVLTNQSTRVEKADAERWVRANKMAFSILESAMIDTVRGGIKKYDLAIDYLNAIERKFKESQKAEINYT